MMTESEITSFGYRKLEKYTYEIIPVRRISITNNISC